MNYLTITAQERRVLCAERIGWTCKVYCGLSVWTSPDRRNQVAEENLPNPESDAKDTMKLVEWLEAKGLWPSASKNLQTGQWRCSLASETKFYEATAPTFNLAIVAAFLAATENL